MTPPRHPIVQILVRVSLVVLLSVAFSFIPNNGPLRAVELMLILVSGLAVLKSLISSALGMTRRTP